MNKIYFYESNLSIEDTEVGAKQLYSYAQFILQKFLSVYNVCFVSVFLNVSESVCPLHLKAHTFHEALCM